MKILITLLLSVLPIIGWAQLKTDTYETSVGNIDITLVGHSSLMIGFNGKVIHVDPYGKAGDYTHLPKADLVLITHEHSDHFDPQALEQIIRTDTEIITSKTVAGQYDKADMYMENGDVYGWENVRIQAVPAYNIVHKRETGEHYHPQGRGNGYVLTFGEFVLYIAGDTEPIPDMDELETIDVAFIPERFPFAPNSDDFFRIAKKIRAKVIYPYHSSQIDKEEIQRQLPDIEIK